ncbi:MULTISPECIES: UPF0182 family membrane protein [unclassified Candidatus Frackibacter]|uniref:UPF0182 family membrane protein n=1 Tax=unclassified Candidatus Frackibacter TaxID=2648818 RepID=UPI0008864A5D|nr:MULTISPECIES: UPF0182 family protein [unclassified Candidatus Frackibacter]SDC37981.1 hypothetical protein SAMN04515661_10865 [Candidatus Frackibacter sp. WG11]SEM62217.1 hypothetical protein SAMN04488698_10924 [Candidatus Frackibacter sp. WG12]SFL65692.1 hypothetical protein SAMN04488699_10866 [Candidatus Frackibacter sp. WG13]
MQFTRKFLFIIVALGLIISSLFLSGINFYTDWLWFDNIGYLSVFKTIFFTKIGISIGIGLLFALFVFINLLITKKEILEYKDANKVTIHDVDDPLAVEKNQFLDMINSKNLTWVFLGISILISLLFSSINADAWRIVKEFLNSSSFGVADPIFNKDIGFYVFKLPFYKFLYQLLTVLLIVSGIISAAIYLFINSERLLSQNINQASRARLHLSVLVALFMLLKAGGYWLSRYDLLYSGRGVVFGASYTDINASLLAFNVLTVIAVIVAIFMLINIFTKNLKLVFGGIVALIIASIALGSIYPALIQRFQVEPNEIAKETPYIKYNIKSTKLAYNLDEVEEREFKINEDLTLQDIKDNPATINNIRLWDSRPLKQTYSQLQEMRLYYNFKNIDIDRYKINGEYRQVMLSARELNQNQLPTRANTWINKKLKYTHGFGLAMNFVNQVTSEGLPEFLIKNIPPESDFQLKVKEPRIYFGEQTNNYVITNTKSKEFDFPMGDQNAYTTYQGSGGVELSSIIRKLAFSIRFGTFKMILNNDITRDSRLLYDRNIKERINKIAPFLEYDRDPYLVLNDDGKLYWIQDAYTTTNMYPYSEPYNGAFNYIRNSVKVVVDAYTGEVNYYIVDDSDPLVKTYGNIFPNLFKPFSQMPEGLKKHIRYPEDLFKVQAKLYEMYHMENPVVFYNNEDLWNIPNEKFAGNSIQMQPYYTIMQLPNENKSEFILMLPFTPARKNNMVSWLAAKSDGKDYGKLVLYEFSKQELTYGPMQIEARIDQDSSISQKLSLWNQKGSSVIRGNLLVIPIENSLLYVEPIYLQAQQSQLPQMKRVIVAFGDKLVMTNNLEDAFTQIFGVAKEEPQEPKTEIEKDKKIVDVENLTKRALELYKQAQDSLTKGQWSRYGELINKLGNILEDLNSQSK